MRRAVYPGSFDPITNGHLDILHQATAIFDEVVVAVLHNPGKNPMFTADERVALVKQVTKAYERVSVASFSGLLVDYYKTQQFHAVVRGIRNSSDLHVEMQMAHMNQSLSSDVHTVFLPASPNFSFVSSSLVKDVAMHGGEISPYVPSVVRDAVLRRLSTR